MELKRATSRVTNSSSTGFEDQSTQSQHQSVITCLCEQCFAGARRPVEEEVSVHALIPLCVLCRDGDIPATIDKQQSGNKTKNEKKRMIIAKFKEGEGFLV